MRTKGFFYAPKLKLVILKGVGKLKTLQYILLFVTFNLLCQSGCLLVSFQMLRHEVMCNRKKNPLGHLTPVRGGSLFLFLHNCISNLEVAWCTLCHSL